jgi:hypothetical protein
MVMNKVRNKNIYLSNEVKQHAPKEFALEIFLNSTAISCVSLCSKVCLCIVHKWAKGRQFHINNFGDKTLYLGE